MWHEKATRRYSGFISSLKVMYKAGKSRPIYVPLELWSGLINHWKDPNVIKRFEAAKRARMSEPDGPGTGISRQRGGSVSVEERSMRKARVQEIAVQQGENANLSQIFINDVFGGKLDKKKRMFGTGNLAKSLVGGQTPGLNAHASTGLDPAVRAEIREELRTELREELREEMCQELNADREQRTKLESDVGMMREMMKLFMTTAGKSSHASESSVGI